LSFAVKTDKNAYLEICTLYANTSPPKKNPHNALNKKGLIRNKNNEDTCYTTPKKSIVNITDTPLPTALSANTVRRHHLFNDNRKPILLSLTLLYRPFIIAP